jgi:hypothetical protein
MLVLLLATLKGVRDNRRFLSLERSWISVEVGMWPD